MNFPSDTMLFTARSSIIAALLKNSNKTSSLLLLFNSDEILFTIELNSETGSSDLTISKTSLDVGFLNLIAVNDGDLLL